MSRPGLLLALAIPLLMGAGPSAALLEQYQKRLGQAPEGDTKAKVELAAWCLASGLKAEGEDLYRAVLEKEPDHAAARKALGYVKEGAEWITATERKRREEHARLEAEAAALKGDDLKGLLKLAERARKASFEDLARACLDRVLAADPDHAAARRMLRQTRFEEAWQEDRDLLAAYVGADSEARRKAIAEALKASGSELGPERLEGHRRWAAAPRGFQERLPLKGKAYETYYHLSVPESYTGLDRVPLIVLLHGGGVGMGDPDMVSAFRTFTDPKGWIMALPMAPHRDRDGVGMWTQTESEACVMDLVARIREQYAVDPLRLYLAGGSAGGWGTLHIGARHVGLFAALGALCPEAMGADGLKLSKIPLYIVHGSEDHVCEVGRVRALSAQLRGLGAAHKYVEVKGAGHALPEDCKGGLFDWIAGFTLPDPKAARR